MVVRVVLGDELKMDKIIALKVLSDEVSSCTACKLHSTRTQTVFARGNPNAEIVFVGEAPGADEDAQGFPFVGRAGKLLDSMIEAMSYKRDDIYVCNIVKCRPPNNRKPELIEMDTCKPFLVRQLDIVKPKVIIALGATAVEGLLGPGLGITKRRGTWDKWNEIPVMPTLHPAYLLRNPPAKIDCAADLKKVLDFLKGNV